jgi:hypothetical protein
MGLTIVALVLFLAMVAAWVILPGSASVSAVPESSEGLAPNTVGQTA